MKPVNLQNTLYWSINRLTVTGSQHIMTIVELFFMYVPFVTIHHVMFVPGEQDEGVVTL